MRKPSDRLKGAIAVATLGFLIQLFLLVFDVRFIDEATGQFAIGTELRFRFFDETTREFVLASQVGELPRQVRDAALASAVVAAVVYLALGIWPPRSRRSESGS